jgi:hypothetical protein
MYKFVSKLWIICVITQLYTLQVCWFIYSLKPCSRLLPSKQSFSFFLTWPLPRKHLSIMDLFPINLYQYIYSEWLRESDLRSCRIFPANCFNDICSYYGNFCYCIELFIERSYWTVELLQHKLKLSVQDLFVAKLVMIFID